MLLVTAAGAAEEDADSSSPIASVADLFWPLGAETWRPAALTLGQESNGLARFRFSMPFVRGFPFDSSTAGPPARPDSSSSMSVKASSSRARSRVSFCCSVWKSLVGLIDLRVKVLSGLTLDAPSSVCSSRPRSSSSMTSSSSRESSKRRYTFFPRLGLLVQKFASGDSILTRRRPCLHPSRLLAEPVDRLSSHRISCDALSHQQVCGHEEDLRSVVGQ